MSTKEILTIIEYVKKHIGIPAVLLIISSLLLLLFAEFLHSLNIDSDFLRFLKILDNGSDDTKQSLIVLTFVAFAVLVLVIALYTGFSHYIKSTFDISINKGFIDGLASGLAAGIIGGSNYAWPLLSTTSSEDTFSYGVIRVASTSLVIGGFYGIVLGLFKQSHSFFLRKRLSACLIFSAFIIFPIISIAVYLGAQWPNTNMNFLDCSEIMIVITIYIILMVAAEIWNHKTVEDKNLKTKIKFLLKREGFLIAYLFLLGFLFLGLSKWFEFDLFKFEFKPEFWATGLIVSIILLIWSASGYLLFTWNNCLTKKLNEM